MPFFYRFIETAFIHSTDFVFIFNSINAEKYINAIAIRHHYISEIALYVVCELCYSHSHGTHISGDEKGSVWIQLGVLMYILWCKTDCANTEVIYSR